MTLRKQRLPNVGESCLHTHLLQFCIMPKQISSQHSKAHTQNAENGNYSIHLFYENGNTGK